MTGADIAVDGTEDFDVYRCSPYEHTETVELQPLVVIPPAIQATQPARTIRPTVARIPSTPRWLRMQPAGETFQFVQPTAVELIK